MFGGKDWKKVLAVFSWFLRKCCSSPPIRKNRNSNPTPIASPIRTYLKERPC